MAHVEIFSRRELSNCPRWSYAFATERKDHRYYEILEDTTHPEFNYGYFGIKDTDDNICAVQPFFILAVCHVVPHLVHPVCPLPVWSPPPQNVPNLLFRKITGSPSLAHQHSEGCSDCENGNAHGNPP
jgi:hypothetical protein